MTKVEKEAYYRHLDNIVILRDNINTERAEGRAEGIAEGRAEGRAEGIAEGIAEGEKLKQMEIARNMKKIGMDLGTISTVTGLSEEDIRKI